MGGGYFLYQGLKIEIKSQIAQILLKQAWEKSLITKNPYSVEEDTLVLEILTFMNKKKKTNLCVYKKVNKKKTIG